ncbi:MAG: tRNA pseudouridine(38-40) synthase TruA [Eubacteriales bacterium]|nr:tRNA pseudouridine(38-40) synthase TruA [Eubacteriales bacterium]
MKRNYKMTLSYDGTRFYGWEHQPGQEMTIQGKLETVLTRMLEGEQEKRRPEERTPVGTITVIGAGRTDAGVHAKAMTANVLLDTVKTEDEIRAYMNRYLPDDICVQELKICADRFHSRFKAMGKTYCYTCFYGGKEGVKPIFDRKYVTTLEQMPDVARMREAASYLEGMHDYKSFCGNSHMKKSTIRVVDTIEIRQNGPYIRISVHGSGFLQNMVRILVGTLLEVGYGKRKPEDMTALLEAKDRKLAGPTAPAQGLCLMQVDY